ncbi:MAG: hypothetical protein K6L73_08185 [Cellvibrionaceae bacterium]
MSAAQLQLDHLQPIRISFATILPHTENIFEIGIDSHTTVNTGHMRELCDALSALGNKIAVIYNQDGDYEFSVGAQQLIGSLPNVITRAVIARHHNQKLSIMETSINTPFDWIPQLFESREKALAWLKEEMRGG